MTTQHNLSDRSNQIDKIAKEDRIKKILRMRAEKLAFLEESGEKHETTDVLVFLLGKEKYGIELKYIKEVYPFKEVTSLPFLPPFILGIINIRRKILSLIDLKILFGLPQEGSKNKRIIVLENGQMESALLVDRIEGIASILMEEFQFSLPTITGIKQEFLKGITLQGLIFLDGEKILNSKKLIVE